MLGFDGTVALGAGRPRGSRRWLGVSWRRSAVASVQLDEFVKPHPELAPLYDLRIRDASDAATVLQAGRDRAMGSWAREWERMFPPSVELCLRTDPVTRADLLAADRVAGAEDHQ